MQDRRDFHGVSTHLRPLQDLTIDDLVGVLESVLGGVVGRAAPRYPVDDLISVLVSDRVGVDHGGRLRSG